MKANSQMDEWIRARLQNLEISYDPETWEMLEQRMNAASASLDDTIADKIANLKVTTPAANWNTMEQLLDIEDATETIENEASVESVVYEKLTNYTVPFQESHWKRMAQRLETEFVLRRKILHQKVADLVLMALLLLSLIRFQPLLLNQDQPVHDKQHLENQVLEPFAADKNLNYLHSKTTIAGNEASSILPPIKNQQSNTANLHNQSAFAVVADNERRNENQHSIVPLPVRAMKQLKLKAEESSFRVKNAITRSHNNFDLLSNEITKVSSQTISALILPKAKMLQAPTEVRFSLLSTVDYNIVATPADRFEFLGNQIRTDNDTTAASGYGGGILVDFKRNRWDFQTGGIYSFKRYIPNTPVLLFQTVNYYVKEDFHGIQQDILQVPLTLNYYFKNNGNWRLYGGFGVAGHFITSSIYEFRYTYTPAFNLLVPNPPSEEETPSIKEEKEFPKGLFDGGSFKDNFYLTANLGVGIERYFYGRTSIFLQPNYQHYLMEKGIGTNKDKIYTFSLFLGIRLSLK